ncbi:brachyurin-like [Diorhabda sublineata]|uniref:brachyurin-like n=1 Tax=Diorhabda sublineata TaxID=1163346 RepID=UPI0024E0B02A|nr:brachyurin-like [Diorhabda sublineata]
MKAGFNFLAVIFVLVKAEVDWNKVFPNELNVESEIPVKKEKTHSKIVGGIESVPHSRPYQVALIVPVPGGTSFCGGSLISNKTILTAAHCVDSLTGGVDVILGAHNVRKKEKTQLRLLASNIILHPDWNRNRLKNDIALINLPSEIEFTDYIKPIKIASEDLDYGKEKALVSGWGRPFDGARGISSVLREVDVPVITNSWCNLKYLGVVGDGQVCVSGSDGKSTCNGDSGGPLTFNGVQIGIVSFGVRLGCEVGWPAVFTRVSSYVKWINENMNCD